MASAVVPDALGFDGEAFVDTVLPSGNWGGFPIHVSERYLWTTGRIFCEVPVAQIERQDGLQEAVEH